MPNILRGRGADWVIVKKGSLSYPKKNTFFFPVKLFKAADVSKFETVPIKISVSFTFIL